MTAMLLQDLPQPLRPREKIAALGPAALTDVELLALLLRTGVKGHSVLQLAQSLLTRFQGLAGLLQATPQDLRSVKGLGGPAKRAELSAVLELSRRAMAEQMQARDLMSSPEAVKLFLQMHMAHCPHEVFGVLFLDAQHRMLSFREMFQGTLTQTSVYPREVVKAALDQGAHAVVLAHNHPSGSVLPSKADETLTQTLRNALLVVDIRVLDHVIVAPGQALSMLEKGYF
jgi:DNA repair protein RadC